MYKIINHSFLCTRASRFLSILIESVENSLLLVEKSGKFWKEGHLNQKGLQILIGGRGLAKNFTYGGFLMIIMTLGVACSNSISPKGMFNNVVNTSGDGKQVEGIQDLESPPNYSAFQTKGNDDQPHKKDKIRKTILHKAVIEGKAEVIEFMLDSEDVDLNALDEEEKTALDYAKDEKIISLLTARGAYKNLDRKLTSAVEKGDEKLVNEVLIQGGDITIKDKDANNLLHLASKQGSLEVVKLFITKKPDLKKEVNKDNNTPLEVAIKSKHDPLLNYLISEYPIGNYMSDITNLNGLKTDLETEVVALNNENIALLIQITELNTWIAEITKAKNDFENQASNLQNQNIELNTKVTSISQQKDQLENSDIVLKEEIKKLNRKVQQLEEDEKEKSLEFENYKKYYYDAPPRTLRGHTNTNSVLSLVYLQDKNLLASGNSDKTINIWNLANYTLVETLQWHTNSVYSLVYLQDKNLLASGGEDKTINIWNLSNYTVVKTLQEHTSYVWSLVYLQDKNLLASGSSDKTIKIWNI